MKPENDRNLVLSILNSFLLFSDDGSKWLINRKEKSERIPTLLSWTKPDKNIHHWNGGMYENFV